MAAYASKLNLFFSLGGYGLDSTYRGALTRMALWPAVLAYGEPFTAARAVASGGNPHEVQGDHAAGIACVGVARHRFTADQLRAVRADYVITSLTGELPLEGMEVTA
jgi:phosphoglycolate phosphatase